MTHVEPGMNFSSSEGLKILPAPMMIKSIGNGACLQDIEEKLGEDGGIKKG